MTIYLFVFWVLAQSAVLMELNLTRRAKIGFLVLSYLILVVFVGLRWETGNDWDNYYQHYIHLPSPPEELSHFEIGYRAFSLAAHAIGLPFACFNLIYAAVYLGLIFLSFKHDNFKISGWLVLQLFAPFLMGLMGTTRQVMAMAICMFSVRYLVWRDWLKFLLCVAAATAFHISALVFLLAWPLSRLQLTFRRIWIIFVLVIVAAVFDVGGTVIRAAEERATILRLADVASRIELEQQSNAEQFKPASAYASVLLAASRVSLLALFVLCYRLFSEESDQLYLKFYLFSIILIVLLSSSVYVLAERITLYFSIFQIHLLATLLHRFKPRVVRIACCTVLILLSLARLYTGTHSIRPQIYIPYKGVFINQDVKRDPGWF